MEKALLDMGAINGGIAGDNNYTVMSDPVVLQHHFVYCTGTGIHEINDIPIKTRSCYLYHLYEMVYIGKKNLSLVCLA